MKIFLIIIIFVAAYIVIPFIFSIISMLFPLLLLYGALYILGYLGKK